MHCSPTPLASRASHPIRQPSFGPPTVTPPGFAGILQRFAVNVDTSRQRTPEHSGMLQSTSTYRRLLHTARAYVGILQAFREQLLVLTRSLRPCRVTNQVPQLMVEITQPQPRNSTPFSAHSGPAHCTAFALEYFGYTSGQPIATRTPSHLSSRHAKNHPLLTQDYSRSHSLTARTSPQPPRTQG